MTDKPNRRKREKMTPVTGTSIVSPAASTEASAGTVTEAVTEAATEAATEATTEAATEATTEAATEATTEAATTAPPDASASTRSSEASASSDASDIGVNASSSVESTGNVIGTASDIPAEIRTPETTMPLEASQIVDEPGVSKPDLSTAELSRTSSQSTASDPAGTADIDTKSSSESVTKSTADELETRDSAATSRADATGTKAQETKTRNATTKPRDIAMRDAAATTLDETRDLATRSPADETRTKPSADESHASTTKSPDLETRDSAATSRPDKSDDSATEASADIKPIVSATKLETRDAAARSSDLVTRPGAATSSDLETHDTSRPDIEASDSVTSSRSETEAAAPSGFSAGSSEIERARSSELEVMATGIALSSSHGSDEPRAAYERHETRPIFYDDPEAATLPAPEPLHVTLPASPVPAPAPSAEQMPDPAAAALEAARIAGEIVGDIESASGAAIVAAAAAGAAIEAARARRAMGGPSPRESHPAMDAAAIAAAAGASAPAASGTAADPTPTVSVRMQRERILRALAEDVAATATQAEGRPVGRIPATQPGTRPVARPEREGEAVPVGDELVEDDGLDPVQIAAAAIQRLRQRARTDFAELRVHYHRHDLFVLLFAFVIIVVAGRVHQRLVTPPTQIFEQRGLQLELQQGWLGPEPIAPTPPRIIRPADGQPPRPSGAFHAAFTWPHDPNARVEILIDKKPSWTNTVTWLDLDRRTRWGELYSLDDSSIRAVEDQDWLRTEYRYAHAIEKGDVPRVDRAVEYATIDREQLYVITMFGSASQIDRMESVLAPSLRVPTRSGLPLVTQTRSLVQRTFPGPVQAAFDSTVMVVVADLGPDGRLRASGGGSGVIVGSDGSILTAYHVLHREKGQLHDVFVIGRFGSRDQAPQLVCAGRPSRSKFRFEEDLALVKCDTDLDGRTWVPKTVGIWPTLLEGRDEDVRMGQRLWVLGYPDAGGGGLTLNEGEVEGWTGVDGAAGKTFIKTSASITTGNSGGPVVDDQGRLVGIASGFRPKLVGQAQSNVIELKQTGLVRPITTASCLLAIAQLGWKPRENTSSCEIEPTAVEASAEGIRIQTRVVDGANDAPVRDALVMVLRRGVEAAAVDVNRLNDQVLAWGRSNSQGEVQLKQPVPVPGTYTVMVVATGYEALIEQNALVLDEANANVARAVSLGKPYDPWGKIEVRSR